ASSANTNTAPTTCHTWPCCAATTSHHAVSTINSGISSSMNIPERVPAALSRIMVRASFRGFQNDITLKSEVNTKEPAVEVAVGSNHFHRLSWRGSALRRRRRLLGLGGFAAGPGAFLRRPGQRGVLGRRRGRPCGGGARIHPLEPGAQPERRAVL